LTALLRNFIGFYYQAYRAAVRSSRHDIIWFAQAQGSSPAMFSRSPGAGSLYWLGFSGKAGAYLDGGKTYKAEGLQPLSVAMSLSPVLVRLWLVVDRYIRAAPHLVSEGFLQTARAKTRMTAFAQLMADAPAA
jgi:hypothetical protein